MARIPQAELDRLKREVSIERLATSRGIALKKHGENLLGLCPFHDDHEPSLVITPAKNLWHCLGACGAGGSVIDWVMKAHAVSFRHAVELLQEDLPPLEEAPGLKGVKHSTVKRLSLPLETDLEDAQLLLQVVDYYHQTLKESPEALAYLEERGLSSSEMIDRFKLGYANRTLGYRLPDKNRQAGAALRGRLQALGIMRESGHEHLNGSLVIPIFDEQGRVSEMYGRKIGARLRAGTSLHMYLPGPHRGVWNEPALEASAEVILCESLIDALTFWCAGFRNVTASYGTEGFTADHLAAFQRHGIRRVLIAYDRDEAGDRAAEALALRLAGHGLESYRVLFPRGMDANEYALKVTPADKSLGTAIRAAVWMHKGEASARPVSMPPAPPASTPSAPPEPAPELEADPAPPATQATDNGPPTTPPVPPEPEPEPTRDPEAPAAERLPTSAPPELPLEQRGEEIVIALGDRRWRVRGLSKNLSFDSLRVNLLVSRGGAWESAPGAFHVDTFDLYAARARTVFINQAAAELGLSEEVLKRDLGRVLLALEDLQEKQIKAELTPKDEQPDLSDDERHEALALLRDPRLLERILEDFDRCGVVGERTNKLVGYLAAVSRKLERPLAVIVQSASAAGKSSLMEAILSFMPSEEQVKYSAMTGQSLFYMGEADLAHKILAIVEEEGAEKASYALKLLQSEGELTIASTGKDATTGRLVTYEYRVEGPVMILLTTTAVEVDEELLNRCLVLTVNEDREQTKAIHKLQRRRQTLAGLLAAEDSTHIRAVHQNAQRLLRPLLVVNPYAEALTFLDDRTRTRRDHMKYLTLIRSIALLYQHQRPVKTVAHRGRQMEYIEVAPHDIEVANELCREVLGRTLDELPPQTRRLLGLVEAMVKAGCERLGVERPEYRFSRRAVREYTGWGNTQVRLHLDRLVELEYLLVHHGGRGQSFVYELVYDGVNAAGQAVACGLIDAEKLTAQGYDVNLAGFEPELTGGWRGQDGAKTGVWRGAEIDATLAASSSFEEPISNFEKRVQGEEAPRHTVAAGRSHSRPSLVAASAPGL